MTNAIRRQPLELRVGAVAMIDALGFQGIWKRYSEHDVVAKLERMADVTARDAHDLQEAARAHGGNVLEFVRPAALSDTLVFCVATKPIDVVTQGLHEEGWGNIIKFDDETLEGEAVRLCAELLAAILRRALEDPVPLAYRGAIAFGRFGMTDRFVIGPAIDEAAEWMDKPHAAIVALAPSAAKYSQAEVPSAVSNLFRYDVPMNEKRHDSPKVNTWTVAPFAGLDDAAQKRKLRDNLIITFGQSPSGSIAEKLTNTLSFFGRCRDGRDCAVPRFA